MGFMNEAFGMEIHNEIETDRWIETCRFLCIDGVSSDRVYKLICDHRFGLTTELHTWS